MEPWYSKAVSNAVREAMMNRAVLLVYVRDHSEQSQAVDQLWPTVWPKFPDTTKYVALRLDKDTEPCNQFMAMFKVNTFPTIYFINGQNGQTLKVIDHPLENAEALEKAFSEALMVIQPETPTAATNASVPASDAASASNSPPTGKSVEERVRH